MSGRSTSTPSAGTTAVGRRPRGRRRHRRLRLRRRRQPDPPRRPGHRARRVGQRRAAREGRRCWRCSAPTVRHRRGRDRRRCPTDVDLVVTSPGRAADRAAARARPPRAASRSGARSSWPGGCATPSTPAPWLCVTGTNGKTTTVQMLDTILRAAGLQQHRLRQRRPADRRGGDGPRAVRRLRRRAVQLPAALHLVDVGARPPPCSTSPRTTSTGTPRLERLRRRQGPDLRAGPARPASTTSPTRSPSSWSATPTSSRAPARSASPSARPGVGMVGVVEDVLADRAFVERAASTAPPSCAPSPTWPRRRRTSSPTRSPPRRWPGPSACRPPRSATGCASFTPDGHRIADVGEVDGVRYVDDSKATNPHAATSSLQAYDPVVWVAGGLAKGATFDDLVTARARPAARRRAARPRPRGHRGGACATRARCPGDRSRAAATLLSWTAWSGRLRTWPSQATPCCSHPGCASMDMFANYGARGDAFAESVRRLRGPVSRPARGTAPRTRKEGTA